MIGNKHLIYEMKALLNGYEINAKNKYWKITIKIIFIKVGILIKNKF